MTTQSTSERKQALWPKLYLLKILNMAVEQGNVLIETMDAKQAMSLSMALARIRRRSDKLFASHINEQHMLCSTRIQPDGKLLVLYDKLPDDDELPAMSHVGSEDDRRMRLPLGQAEPYNPQEYAPPIPEPAPTAFDPEDFMAQMLGELDLKGDG